MNAEIGEIDAFGILKEIVKEYEYQLTGSGEKDMFHYGDGLYLKAKQAIAKAEGRS